MKQELIYCKCGCGQRFERYDRKGRPRYFISGHFKSNLPKISNLEARFWKKVVKLPDDGCWEWSGYLTSTGYGSIMQDYKNIKAHRLSWEIHYGLIPEGMLICHKCDNRKCVRPDHLFLGTFLLNHHDALSKGRNKGKPIMNNEVVLMRKLFKDGRYNQIELANIFGISRGTVGGIVNYKKRTNV